MTRFFMAKVPFPSIVPVIFVLLLLMLLMLLLAQLLLLLTVLMAHVDGRTVMEVEMAASCSDPGNAHGET